MMIKEQLYIRFDEGQHIEKYVDYKISNAEAKYAMQSEKNAYLVCIAAQNRNKKK